MYESLKSLVKKVVPSGALKSLDNELRFAYSLLYLGNKVACNCCEGAFSRWILLGNGEQLCPRCGSLPRTRRLFSVLEKRYLDSADVILHFSPGKVLQQKITGLKGDDYESSDYVGEFDARFTYDILDIDAPSEKYDLVICYHVLEHIEKDEKAMSELFRVLKPGGTCLIQTPFKPGDIYEDYSITSPEERLVAFGQDDHVRVYSVAGLAGRLSAAGFEVNPVEYSGDDYRGFKGGETVLFCVKGRRTDS